MRLYFSVAKSDVTRVLLSFIWTVSLSLQSPPASLCFWLNLLFAAVLFCLNSHFQSAVCLRNLIPWAFECSRSVSSSPLLSSAGAGHRLLRIAAEATKQYRRRQQQQQQQKVTDTMNSNLSALPTASPSCSYCPAGLKIIYAHPQSCFKTKGQRKRREIETVAIKRGDFGIGGQARVQFTDIIPPKLLCARRKIRSRAVLLISLFYLIFSRSHTDTSSSHRRDCTITAAVGKHKWGWAQPLIGEPMDWLAIQKL